MHMLRSANLTGSCPGQCWALPYTHTSVHDLQPSCQSLKPRGCVNPCQGLHCCCFSPPHTEEKVESVSGTEGGTSSSIPTWINYGTGGQHNTLLWVGWNHPLKAHCHISRSIPCRGAWGHDKSAYQTAPKKKYK